MVGCIVLFLLFSLNWIWMVALAVGLAGMFSDKLTHWIHLAWFWIAEKLGYVTSKIVLGTLFVVVLLPLALLAKLFRKDFMLLKDRYPSYFVERPHVFQRKDLENPW